ncbi:DUF3465 domain-containing protein [Lysobacter sp. HA35]
MRRPATVVTLLLAGVTAGLAGCEPEAREASTPSRALDAGAARPENGSIVAAVRAHAQAAQVDGHGRVGRVLPDDREGSPHQRFLIALDDGTTVLVAHNIDLSPRLDGIAAGDDISFRGEYIWNPKGGTLHWTHRDPHGTHPGGWLRWRGRTYD